jgi:hypothetical protein
MVESSAVAPLETVTLAFASGIVAKRSLLHVDLRKEQMARVLESLTQDIRKYCDVVFPLLRPIETSNAALMQARLVGGDLCQLTWHQQARMDPAGRSTFHLEHITPVKSIRTACIAASDQGEIVSALMSIRIAWILKSENDELDRLKFRHNRPDPTAAYAAAGIELAACDHGC